MQCIFMPMYEAIANLCMGHAAKGEVSTAWPYIGRAHSYTHNGTNNDQNGQTDGPLSNVSLFYVNAIFKPFLLMPIVIRTFAMQKKL